MLNPNSPQNSGVINQDVVNSFQPQQQPQNPWDGMLQQITPGSTYSSRGGFKLPGSTQSTGLAGVTQNIQGMKPEDVNMNKSDLGLKSYMDWQESQNNPAGPNYKQNAWNSLASTSNVPSNPSDGLFGSLTGLLGNKSGSVFSSSPFGI